MPISPQESWLIPAEGLTGGDPLVPSGNGRQTPKTSAGSEQSNPVYDK